MRIITIVIMKSIIDHENEYNIQWWCTEQSWAVWPRATLGPGLSSSSASWEGTSWGRSSWEWISYSMMIFLRILKLFDHMPGPGSSSWDWEGCYSCNPTWMDYDGKMQALIGKGWMFFCLQAGLLHHRVEGGVKQWDEDTDKQHDLGIFVSYSFDLIVRIFV